MTTAELEITMQEFRISVSPIFRQFKKTCKEYYREKDMDREKLRARKRERERALENRFLSQFVRVVLGVCVGAQKLMWITDIPGKRTLG